LSTLGRQFGYATGSGNSLRTAIDNPSPEKIRGEYEPHMRGMIFLSAVFDAFFSVFERRTRDLVRLSGGQLPTGASAELHPDLLNRLADEASRVAQSLMDRCIRAFDYLPPVDITFGDYLRALVTADFELTPEDEQGLRAALIEAFRRRSIYPAGISSFAEESLLWEQWSVQKHLHPKAEMAVELMNINTLQQLVRASSFERDQAIEAQDRSRGSPSAVTSTHENDLDSETFSYLHGFARRNYEGLRLDPNPNSPIEVNSFYSVFRILPNGRPRIEHVVQFTQLVKGSEKDFGGIPLRGGSTMILSAVGEVRYVISKPLPKARGLSTQEAKAAETRLLAQERHLGLLDSLDPCAPYYSKADRSQRMKLRTRLSAIHQGYRS
ncbi:MAG: hypothetical protein ACREPB_14610, partial [Arenimonas sp.]